MSAVSIARRALRTISILLIFCLGVFSQSIFADDYILTLGGGYNPSGNQASLEENVLFFLKILNTKRIAYRQHEVFFADGTDPKADLQVMATSGVKVDRPATELLASLHRRPGKEQVEYRNHRVPHVAGPLDPQLVRLSMEALSKTMKRGDRLIVYVTAHGSEGPEDDEFDTTIDCWNEKVITVRNFAQWLNAFPTEVPVVMIMAQCYCGGFARSIFEDVDSSRPLSRQLRAGFFAQQHNLPAQGCRPDIEHDEEFSSYFLGAIVGHSRTGVPIEGCDLDGNGVVSFAEAYTYAFWAGETIDIPLKTSDVFLRQYSRLSPGNPAPRRPGGAEHDSKVLRGSLQSFIDRGDVMSGRIIKELSKKLGFKLEDDAAIVVAAYDEHRNAPPLPDRGRRRGVRRDLLREIEDKWPELGDVRKWEESKLLDDQNQADLYAEMKKLPSWEVYERSRLRTEEFEKESERHELREVKFRRLVKTLELIILEENLPRVSSPELVERYRRLTALERSSFHEMKP